MEESSSGEGGRGATLAIASRFAVDTLYGPSAIEIGEDACVRRYATSW